MNPKVAQAIQEIDAALFSSDEFENEAAIKELRHFVDRWDRQLTLNDMQFGESSRCHICGGPNH